MKNKMEPLIATIVAKSSNKNIEIVIKSDNLTPDELNSFMKDLFSQFSKKETDFNIKLNEKNLFEIYEDDIFPYTKKEDNQTKKIQKPKEEINDLQDILNILQEESNNL